MRHRRWMAVLLAVLLCLGGCGAETADPHTSEPLEEYLDTQSPAAPPASGTPYQAPAFLDSAYHADQARGDSGVKLDLSAVSDGYVGVSATSDARLKFQVRKGEDTYNYDIASDGTPSILPLQCGNGEYLFRVMENITESKYAELYSESCQVELRDPFQPFLRPSDYVSYSQQSECVRKASELAANASDAVGVVSEIYSFICSGVDYDKEKALTVQSDYLPNPDETMRTGKGICFDYASLAAAMMRSQGIPAKVIFGYVSPDDLYHAWNMFYTEETGWVTVDYEVKAGDWNRLDLTFSAGGADGTFVGDGNNYSDVRCF